MSCAQSPDCTCGCCAGIAVETPQTLSNPPGQSAIAYRVGNWNTFKQSMLARLSSSDYPALAVLRTREDDDFTIALLDASSVMLDILTFYQERLANESYLGTATQLRSLIELARLIGYQPAPGIASATYLAFTLKSAPGSPPDPNNPAITIPAGSQVQSVPVQGQQPQTFETSADIPAKSDWNALAVESTTPWHPRTNDTSVYLAGTATQLQPGDAILIVGNERIENTASPVWDVRILTSVQPDAVNARTLITWKNGLGGGSVAPSSSDPVVYALRQRTALFGYNALDPNMLDSKVLKQLVSVNVVTLSGGKYSWTGYAIGSTIDLDNIYSKVLPESWVALAQPDGSSAPLGYVSLFRASAVAPVARSNFGMSGKITRITPDAIPNTSKFDLASAIALVQSERLDVAPTPLGYPLYGAVIDLEDVRPDLVNAQVISLSGNAQKLIVAADGLTFTPADGSTPGPLLLNDVITLASPTGLPLDSINSAAAWLTSSSSLTLTVLDTKGRPGTVQATLSQFTFAAPSSSDPVLREAALVSSVNTVLTPTPHTQIILQSGLNYCYERTTAAVNANVALATNGSSVAEVMGSGAASVPNQSFNLKQAPLTFVQAATPNGRQSTLSVRVNGVQWNEVQTLYQQGPSATVFATLNQSGGATTVKFGDGDEGSTLPTGQGNVQAQYRIGSGSAGNVAANTITTLMDRPLGVSGVTNPQAATGGQDADTVGDLRSNAPQTVTTLGRAVSIVDYQNYAANFASVGKAYALWIPAGPGRGVFLTLAGVNGAAVLQGGSLQTNLAKSLADYGSPLVPVRIVTFIETLFSISADIAYDPSYDANAVQASVRQALSQEFSFANRSFGQGVSVDEVDALIQGIAGVIAVNVTSLDTVASSSAGDLAGMPGGLTVQNVNLWNASPVTVPRPASDDPNRICAYLPVPSLTALPMAAEILVLHPDPKYLQLGVMA